MGTSLRGGDFSPSSADMLESLGPAAISDSVIEVEVTKYSDGRAMLPFLVLAGEHDVRPGRE